VRDMNNLDCNDVVRVLRAQAWSRAKGELSSILDTYHGEMEKFDQMRSLIREMVDTVENEGLAE